MSEIVNILIFIVGVWAMLGLIGMVYQMIKEKVYSETLLQVAGAITVGIILGPFAFHRDLVT